MLAAAVPRLPIFLPAKEVAAVTRLPPAAAAAAAAVVCMPRPKINPAPAGGRLLLLPAAAGAAGGRRQLPWSSRVLCMLLGTSSLAPRPLAATRLCDPTLAITPIALEV